MSSLMEKAPANKILSEILQYYKYKVDNNLCTMAEMNDAIKAIESNMEVEGTISDFAKFFDVPETTIRTNINRKMFAKPKRRVYYPFLEFLKIVPFKWLKTK